MAQADGTILINSEIDADGMKAGSKEVEAAVRRMASSIDNLSTKAKTALSKQANAFTKLNVQFAEQEKKVKRLEDKLSEYSKQKVPTEEYLALDKQLNKLGADFDKLAEKQQRFLETGGKTSSTTYKKMEYDLDSLDEKQDKVLKKMKMLESSGKAFTYGDVSPEATAIESKLIKEKQKLSDMNNRLGTSYSSIKGTVNDYKNNLLKASDSQSKASNTGKNLSKSLKDTGKSAKSAQFGIARMLGTSILFSFVFQAISAVTSGIKEGFTNLAQYSGSTNQSISMLWSSLERLKNSLATAFAPILDVVAPILSKFIDMISTAASYVSMFFAFLSGKSTYTRAVAVQKDYAASLQDTSSSAGDLADSTADDAKATEEATEAAEDYLSPLDDINKYNEENSSGSGTPGAGTGGKPGSGIDGVTGEGPLFEEVEITDIPILENLKDILSKLFQPFKEAWDKEGQATIDAAKYAFESIINLAKSVGRSFLEVWTNGTGTETLTLILQIAQNIFKIIGNIASKLDEAWNTNNLGTQIIQNIFDLLNIVLDTIKNITGATEEWSRTLDFTPLLTSINDLLSSLKPFAENIGSGLEWFWSNVLLPMAGFTIEEIIPRFFESLANAISLLNNVLEPLQPLFQWFWDYIIVPIAEWTGGVFLTIWDGINNVLKTFSDWCAANPGVIENMAIIIGSFVAAWGIVNLASTIAGIVGALVGFIATGGLAAGVATVLGAAIGFLTSPITLAVAAIGIIIAAGILLCKNWDKVKEAASKLGEWISEKWDWIKEKTSEAWDFVKNFLSETWGKLKSTASSIFDSIKSKIENVWNSIKTATSSIWTSIKNKIKDSINGIIGGINWMIRGVVSGINTVIRALNGLSFDVPDWVPGFGGKKFGFNIKEFDAPQLPYLASGAVIPPNKEFLAVLGDQKSGNNIEAPEGLIRRIVREETGNGNNKYEVVAKVGRKELLRMVIDEAKIQQQQSGKNPLEFA